MRDTKELLRETRDRIAPPPDVLGSLERRRHHREQVRRGSAAVVAIVVALVGLGGWFVVGRDAADVPVDDPSPSDLGIFADVRGWIAYGDESGISAMDPMNPDAEPILLDPDGGVPVAWSSDGSKLLIQRGDLTSGGGRGELLVLDADGTTTHLADVDFMPGGSFTPDGSQVVFGDAWRSDINVVDADGGSSRLLYDADDSVFAPVLSPDGSRLAFFEGRGDAENSLWVMNVDGTDKRQILGEEEAGRSAWSLQWSPDGTRLVFKRGHDRSFGVVNADGSGLALVEAGVPDLGPGAGPYWSPDGTRLAFATGRDRLSSLAIARPDGTELQELGVGRAGPWNPLDPAPTAPPTTTATQTDGPPLSTPTAFRRGGEFIVFTPRATGAGWDLAAHDPETGEVRRIVETAGIVDGVDKCSGPCTNFIKEAEWSADGRWVAFEVTHASLDGPPLGPCGPTVGLWVQGPSGVPRQLTTPCDAPPSGSDDPIEEMWEWSPVDARLVYARIDGETDELFVIDPSDGTRTSLGTAEIPSNDGSRSQSWPSWALTWSPDGTQLAYVDGNSVYRGDSVYRVDVESGERSVLADSLVDIWNIAWSPDGTQILVQDRTRYRIQVMKADGSDLHVLFQGEDACCSTAWSPNGDRIVFMLSVGRPGEPEWGRFDSGVWTVEPDGSNPIKVFDTASCGETNIDTLPVWTPNGTQVAYNACGEWVAENADGTGDVQPINELVWRSWYSGGLAEWDLAGIGQLDH